MSHNTNRRDFLRAAGAAGVVGLAGCTSGGQNGGGQQNGSGQQNGTTTSGGSGGRTVKLGLLFPETGDLGPLGKPMRDAGRLAVKLVNDADTPITVDAQSEDTQTSAQNGISAAHSLVNAGYPMVAGPAGSGVNLPVSKQVFIPNHVVGCSPSSTAPSVTNLKDDDYVFRTAPSDALQGQVLAQVAANRQNDATASTMFVNNDYGQQLSAAFTNAFESEGGTVQNTVSFQKGQSSYTSRLQKALADSPDALVVVGYPQSGVQLFKDYYSTFSGDTNLLLTDGLQDASLPSKVGNQMTNATGSAAKASGPANDYFTQQYKGAYDAKPSVYTAHSFDAALVLVLANAHAGANDGAKIRDSIRKVANPGDNATDVGPDQLGKAVRMAANGERLNYQGASSAVNFDDNGDMSAVKYSYWGFKNGDVETLDTIDFGK